MAETIIFILGLGVVAVGVVQVRIASLIHERRKDHYTWLKQGGGRVQNISEEWNNG